MASLQVAPGHEPVETWLPAGERPHAMMLTAPAGNQRLTGKAGTRGCTSHPRLRHSSLQWARDSWREAEASPNWNASADGPTSEDRSAIAATQATQQGCARVTPPCGPLQPLQRKAWSTVDSDGPGCSRNGLTLPAPRRALPPTPGHAPPPPHCAAGAPACRHPQAGKNLPGSLSPQGVAHVRGDVQRHLPGDQHRARPRHPHERRRRRQWGPAAHRRLPRCRRRSAGAWHRWCGRRCHRPLAPHPEPRVHRLRAAGPLHRWHRQREAPHCRAEVSCLRWPRPWRARSERPGRHRARQALRRAKHGRFAERHRSWIRRLRNGGCSPLQRRDAARHRREGAGAGRKLCCCLPGLRAHR